MVYSPDHPYASQGYVLEHRLILEQHLREQEPDSPYLVEVAGQLYLRPGIIVHHADETKDNNDVANLRPLTQGEHVAMHNRERAAIRSCS